MIMTFNSSRGHFQNGSQSHQSRKRRWEDGKNVSHSGKVLRPWTADNVIISSIVNAKANGDHRTHNNAFQNQRYEEVSNLQSKAFHESHFDADQNQDWLGQAPDQYHQHQLDSQKSSKITVQRLDFRSKSTRGIEVEAAVNALYPLHKKQCSSCGLRFEAATDLRGHMDWHFQDNMKKKNQKKAVRDWFEHSQSWSYGHLGQAGKKKSLMVLKDSVAPDQNTCALCMETFEEKYIDQDLDNDQLLEGWHFMNAIITERGDLIHPTCR